jgi:hypothetical protein
MSHASDTWPSQVSNANGYLCHIHLEVDLGMPPDVLFQIFVHPGARCVGAAAGRAAD